jgi:ribosomal protein S27E
VEIKLEPDDLAKVIELKVPFKKPEPDEKFLVVDHGHCFHERYGFILDESLEHVLCKGCKEHLSPMWVLKHLAHNETKYHENAKRYQEEMQRLKERSRTKCQHCGEMTGISRS